MDLNILSAREFPRDAIVAGYLKENLETLMKKGVLDSLYIIDWEEAKNGMRNASLFPSVTTRRFAFMEAVWDHAKYVLEGQQIMEWGVSNAIQDAADYAAFEVLRGVYFRAEREWVDNDDGMTREYRGIGHMVSDRGSNHVEPIFKIIESGIVVPNIFREGKRIRAWLAGDRIRKIIDVMEIPNYVEDAEPASGAYSEDANELEIAE